METNALVVLCACCDEEEAGRIARILVEERYSACVNVLPRVRSIYRWQENVESADEFLLLIKTTTDGFLKIRARILELHSYNVPEVIALPIVDGSEKYLSWLREQVE